MALSEYEQRKLHEIERFLHGDDPRLETILRRVEVRHRRVVAVVVFAIGMVGLVLARSPRRARRSSAWW